MLSTRKIAVAGVVAAVALAGVAGIVHFWSNGHVASSAPAAAVSPAGSTTTVDPYAMPAPAVDAKAVSAAVAAEWHSQDPSPQVLAQAAASTPSHKGGGKGAGHSSRHGK